MKLQVPQVRNCEQKFRPSVLECLSRSEKAFRSVLGEIYVKGVSTQKVGKVIESIWPDGVSIFPSESSCIRLISAILIENNENWAGKAYIKNSNE